MPAEIRPLRIAVWHHLPSGGGKRALYDQVRGLHDRGHHLEVWSPPDPDPDFLPLPGLVAEQLVPIEERSVPRRGPVAERLYPYRRQVERLRAMEFHARVCAEQISAGEFDLLLAHPCARFRTSPLGRLVGLPSVLYLQEPSRDLFEATYNTGNRLPWLAPESAPGLRLTARLSRVSADLVATQAKRLRARYERDWTAGYGTVLVNSLYSRESVLRSYGVDAEVCYLGIDTATFDHPPVAKENYVIGVGSIHWSKDPELAIEAVASIAEEQRPALVWVGNFADDRYLIRLRDLARARSVNFEPRVRVDHGELVRLLARARAMVYTSRLEPFGYAPLEANACGTAVVAIAEGGVRESVQDGVNGLLVPTRDPRALGAALERLLGDDGLARRLEGSAREHVERNWALAASIDRLEVCLHAAAARDKPGRPDRGG